jgi:hypothetical protein
MKSQELSKNTVRACRYTKQDEPDRGVEPLYT